MREFPLFEHPHAARAYTITRFERRPITRTKIIDGKVHFEEGEAVEEFTVLIVEHDDEIDPTRGPSGDHKDSLYSACALALNELDDEIHTVELHPAA